MNLSMSWEDLGAVVAVAGFVSAIGMNLIRGGLRREFAGKPELEAMAGAQLVLGGRVQALEVRMGAVLTHGDMAEVFRRIAAVESGVAGVQASVKGIETHLGDLVSNVRLLVEAGLNRDAG